MKHAIRFFALFIAAFSLVAFLPLYITQTMTRSQSESGGDTIGWGLKPRTLYSFWSDYNYFRPEENFFFSFVLNLGLACLYSLVIALAIDRLFTYLNSGKRTKK